MIVSRRLLILAALLLLGLSNAGFASERSHAMVTKAEKALRGTWYSATGSITFKNNGTINYKGKRYFYAVSNGGIIQLSGEHSANAIPYQLYGEKLTLMENGKATVYTRNRPGK
ncbi:MAG TPA: hypothetical protein VMJ33_02660 [Gallionella sp.]|nr:hypothetical protein [Gallionella sp.]